MWFLLERKTLQEPLLVQVDLNWGIKKGVYFKIFLAKMNKEATIKQTTSSLISPTTHLFPLSGQLRSRGVSIKVTLTLWYRRYDKSNQSILFCINETNLERKTKKMQKRKKNDVNPLRGDGEWARKSLFGIIFYYQ